MKVRLNVPADRYEEVREELNRHGIETADDAEYELSAAEDWPDWLSVRRDRDQMHIPAASVLYIESLGHDVFVHAKDGVYNSSQRLVHLEKTLDPSRFLRVSNSVIIRRDQVKKIRTAFTQKFILTMSDGSEVDVSRSYYYIFRNEFGI